MAGEPEAFRALASFVAVAEQTMNGLDALAPPCNDGTREAVEHARDAAYELIRLDPRFARDKLPLVEAARP